VFAANTQGIEQQSKLLTNQLLGLWPSCPPLGLRKAESFKLSPAEISWDKQVVSRRGTDISELLRTSGLDLSVDFSESKYIRTSNLLFAGAFTTWVHHEWTRMENDAIFTRQVKYVQNYGFSAGWLMKTGRTGFWPVLNILMHCRS
jgi:hypothetical protein